MDVARVEEAAGRIAEPDEDRVGQAAGGHEPALLEGRRVEREQAVGEAGMVLEDPVGRGPAVLPAPPQQAVRPAEPGQEQLGRRDRQAAQLRGLSRVLGRRRSHRGRRRVGERRDGQAVPARQHLVVASRLRAAVATLGQDRPALGEPGRDDVRRRARTAPRGPSRRPSAGGSCAPPSCRRRSRRTPPRRAPRARHRRRPGPRRPSRRTSRPRRRRYRHPGWRRTRRRPSAARRAR